MNLLDNIYISLVMDPCTKRDLLCIPTHYKSVIPPSALSVKCLLDFSLPMFDKHDVQPADFFSSSEPSAAITLDTIQQTASIPPLKLTISLIDFLGHAVAEAKRSVVIPGNDLFLLFWILTVWSRLGYAVYVQQCWREASKWIDNHAASMHPMRHLAEEASRALDVLPWNLPLMGPAAGLDSTHLAEFLSEWLVTSAVIDAIMDSIAERVKTCQNSLGRCLSSN
jgi:hypothetical protein